MFQFLDQAFIDADETFPRRPKPDVEKSSAAAEVRAALKEIESIRDEV
jgi:hypothetical protein